MRTRLIFLILLLSIIPVPSQAKELNAGFVQGLWYSTTTVFADIPTRIYVALRNNTESDLSGTIRFTDNGKRIGTAYVSALPGRLVEAWTDWTPEYGEHTVAATLFDVKLKSIGERAELVEVESTLAEDVLLIDYDTDRDGIPNKEDTDDDNDTLLDTDEVKNGTDPLVPTPIKRVEETPKTSNSSDKEESEEQQTVSEVESSIAETARGLERYVEGGIIHDALSNVTNKVTGAKETVDTYREKRREELDNYFDNNESQKTSNDTILTSASSSEGATITRTQSAQKGEGFLKSTFDAGKAIVAGLVTFFLWLVSNLLAHPALVQLAILLGILFIVYRLARRFGRRPKGY